MLSKTEKTFTLIFFLILFAELICGSNAQLSSFRFITKPSIVLSLMAFFWNMSQNLSSSTRIIMMLALVFSLAGDIILLFVNVAPYYFMMGLVAFLLAHLMYIFVFLKHRNKNRNPWTFILILMVYASGLFYLLHNGLGKLLIPVCIYIIVILMMAITAFLRKGIVSKWSYNLVIFGAVLFMVSDSILALNTFYSAIPFSDVGIMLTYGLAQYFIVFGVSKQR